MPAQLMHAQLMLTQTLALLIQNVCGTIQTVSLILAQPMLPMLSAKLTTNATGLELPVPLTSATKTMTQPSVELTQHASGQEPNATLTPVLLMQMIQHAKQTPLVNGVDPNARSNAHREKAQLTVLSIPPACGKIMLVLSTPVRLFHQTPTVLLKQHVSGQPQHRSVPQTHAPTTQAAQHVGPKPNASGPELLVQLTPAMPTLIQQHVEQMPNVLGPATNAQLLVLL